MESKIWSAEYWAEALKNRCNDLDVDPDKEILDIIKEAQRQAIEATAWDIAENAKIKEYEVYTGSCEDGELYKKRTEIDIESILSRINSLELKIE